MSMARTLSSPRSYVRNISGPRPVERSSSSEKHRSGARKDNGQAHQTREKRRSRRDESRRSSKKEQQQSHHQIFPRPPLNIIVGEQPTLELDTIVQPAQRVQLGMSVDVSVSISLASPSIISIDDVDAIDTSGFIAVASLLAETRDGERVPLEPGLLAGQKLFDTIHGVSEEYLKEVAQHDLNKVAVGHFFFPGLVIRQAGNFRLRTTLIKMGNSDNGHSKSIMAIDSEIVQVERRGSCVSSLRRQQQVYV